MKKYLLTALITFLILTSSAIAEDDTSFAITDSQSISTMNYMGESFFVPYNSETAQKINSSSSKTENSQVKKTIPPIKKLRLMIQDKLDERRMKENELAPTSAPTTYRGEDETSEYASKPIVDKFEDMTYPDGFEADEETVSETSKKKKGFFHKKDEYEEPETEDIILDCDNINYDTPNYIVYATGNVNLEFVKQGTIIKAEKLTYDRINNTIKAEENVKIIKGDNVITGDYIFVDMNEENALIENPKTASNNIEMRAKKGYVYGDKIVQEDGTMIVNNSMPLNIKTANGHLNLNQMLTKDSDKLSWDILNGQIRAQAKEIKITQKGDLEILALKNFKMKKDKYTLLKLRSAKFYTNKNHDFLEMDGPEIGSYGDFGTYGGPSWVFGMPKGAVLKLMPIINFRNGVGIGAMGRFTSGTNQTFAGYATSAKNPIIWGRQELDDNLYLDYGMNSYLDEWFLGRRRPKYGIGLHYTKNYSANSFILKGRSSSFSHRIEAGYYHDYDINDGLFMGAIGTTRFRYMALAHQDFISYQNPEKLTAFKFGVDAQLSAAIYGTGDTQFIGRLGPTLHTQYKRWMQDVGYYFSTFDDHTPMPRFDSFMYGKQNFYLREHLRLCRYLTLSWLGSFNLLRDSYDGTLLQENAFFVSVGPDDLRLSIGYDIYRKIFMCFFETKLDAKNTVLDYDKMEVKQVKKSSPEKKVVRRINPNEAPVEAKVLDKAIVEDIQVKEDVL